MWSRAASALVPSSVTTLPFTCTRPSVIRFFGVAAAGDSGLGEDLLQALKLRRWAGLCVLRLVDFVLFGSIVYFVGDQRGLVVGCLLFGVGCRGCESFFGCSRIRFRIFRFRRVWRRDALRRSWGISRFCLLVLGHGSAGAGLFGERPAIPPVPFSRWFRSPLP